jgi:hypothetical protein
MKWLTIVVVMLTLACDAQTNNKIASPQFKTILVTNEVKAVPTYREVDGQLYNTKRSILFKSLEGNCLEVATNGLLIALVEPVWGRMDSLPSWRDGDEYMGLNPSQQVRVGEKETGKIIFLKHYFQTTNPAVTQDLSFNAMQTGTVNYNGHTFELWDCGEPHIAVVVKTNSVGVISR